MLLGLLDAQPGEPGEAVILAGEAVVDARAGGVTQACKQRVVQALLTTLTDDEHVTPIRRARAGRVLAHLGDPRENVMEWWGMEFCHVPSGPFLMGTREGHQNASDDEKPQHEYDIPYSYWIGRYPVTNAQFRHFVADDGYQDPKWWREAIGYGVWRDGQVRRRVFKEKKDNDFIYNDEREIGQFPAYWAYQHFNLPNHPVVGITWYEALAFTRWLNKKLYNTRWLPDGWITRLPSEPEWEKAARGGLAVPEATKISTLFNSFETKILSFTQNSIPSRSYPWGEGADINRMNIEQTDIESTSAVGIFPSSASPYGAEELNGNVWEWTRSLWGRDLNDTVYRYPYQVSDGREILDVDTNASRTMRGGGTFTNTKNICCTIRDWDYPDVRYHFLGFRVLLSPFSLDIQFN